MEKKLKKCEEEKNEYLEGWKRAKADLINYKKEETERTAKLIEYIEKNNILELLPILDNIEIAEKNISSENEWTEGFSNIKKQILSFLEKKGVKPINTKGQLFDPNFQEAVEIIPDPNQKSGIVLEEVQKGYLLGEKVIRPAKVKVIK